MISKIDNKSSNNYINNYQFVIEKYLNYINYQRLNKTDFAFSNIKKTSPYARCFAIFGLYNFSFQVLSEHEKDLLALAVMKDLESFIFPNWFSFFNKGRYSLSCIESHHIFTHYLACIFIGFI